MEKIIKVKNLTKQFKVRRNKNLFTGIFNPDYLIKTPVKDFSFEVLKGEAVAFLGPNGAGKTTTTKMLTGLIFPTSGEVTVLGYKPFERKKDFLMRIGLVMGNKAGLNWDLTATQSFNLLKKIYNISDNNFKTRVSELTSLLSVEKHLDTQIRKLSLGERMKLELIGAILHNPEVLFLDEPTIGLDITSKKNIRKFLKEIQKNSNITLILTSHDMDDIEHVCDRVIVINQGEKVYDASLESIMSKYKQERFVKFIAENLPANVNIEIAVVIEKSLDSILFKVKNEYMPKLITEMTSKLQIIDIEIGSVPLEEMIEDIYMKA